MLLRISLIALLLLCSCAHGITVQPQCRHTSVFCALAMGEKYPVRIIYGETFFGEHAQAQAYINKEWVWLDIENGKVCVVEGGDYWIIQEERTIDQAIKWSTKRFKRKPI